MRNRFSGNYSVFFGFFSQCLPSGANQLGNPHVPIASQAFNRPSNLTRCCQNSGHFPGIHLNKSHPSDPPGTVSDPTPKLCRVCGNAISADLNGGEPDYCSSSRKNWTG